MTLTRDGYRIPNNPVSCNPFLPRCRCDSLRTVAKIRAGNQCEKAERLRGIKGEALLLPKTDYLSNQLRHAIQRQKEGQ